MREFSVALAKSKLLAIVVDDVKDMMEIDVLAFPHASDALAYLESGKPHSNNPDIIYCYPLSIFINDKTLLLINLYRRTGYLQ